jgi:uncharacterized protein (DUF2141 family)
MILKRSRDFLLAVGLAMAALPAMAAGTTLDVRVEGVPSGMVHAWIYRSADGFPGDLAKSWRQQKVEASGSATLQFADVPAGRYAVMVYFDANGNGRLDRNFIGMPSEPVAVTGKASRFGPPTFDSCAIPVAGPLQTVTLKLKTVK